MDPVSHRIHNASVDSQDLERSNDAEKLGEGICREFIYLLGLSGATDEEYSNFETLIKVGGPLYKPNFTFPRYFCRGTTAYIVISKHVTEDLEICRKDASAILYHERLLLERRAQLEGRANRILPQSREESGDDYLINFAATHPGRASRILSKPSEESGNYIIDFANTEDGKFFYMELYHIDQNARPRWLLIHRTEDCDTRKDALQKMNEYLYRKLEDLEGTEGSDPDFYDPSCSYL